MGYQRRLVQVQKLKMPAGSCITVSAGPSLDKLEVQSSRPVVTVCCDSCNAELTGKPGTAVTMYRGEEPPNWEHEYEEGSL